MLVVRHSNLILNFFSGYIDSGFWKILDDYFILSRGGSFTFGSIVRWVAQSLSLRGPQLRKLEAFSEISLERDGQFLVLVRGQTRFCEVSQNCQSDFGVLVRDQTGVLWGSPRMGSRTLGELIRGQTIVLSGVKALHPWIEEVVRSLGRKLVCICAKSWPVSWRMLGN